jgi:hypothetical protein
MSPRPVIVGLLLSNLALAAIIVWMAKNHSNHPAEAGAASTDQAVLKPTAGLEAKVARPAPSFDWRMVESDDYKKYIANLRAIGCPEETIRDIIIADVNMLYESKRRELASPKKKFEFWKPDTMGGAFDPGLTDKERALNQEKRALLTELLGYAPNEKSDYFADVTTRLEAKFDFLPAEKRSKVFELMQDIQGKMQEALKGEPPNSKKSRKMLKEGEDAIAAILTPEEMLDYNLHFSMTANTMRADLVGFEPSEQEFLDIFKLRKANDDEFGMGGMWDPNPGVEEQQKAFERQQKLNDQIQATLGEKRYQEYERAQDSEFQSMYQVADREKLGKEAAIQVYNIRKIALNHADQILGDESLTAERRTAALQAIRSETENSIRTIFGEKGFQFYQQQGRTLWLDRIIR